VAYDVGASLTSWIIPASGCPIARSTVSPLTKEDKITPSLITGLVEFEMAIEANIGNGRPEEEIVKEFSILHPEIPANIYLPDNVKDYKSNLPEADDFTPDSYDRYITAAVMLLVRGEVLRAKVTGRKRDSNSFGSPA
jgi:hypothetical protein